MMRLSTACSRSEMVDRSKTRRADQLRATSYDESKADPLVCGRFRIVGGVCDCRRHFIIELLVQTGPHCRKRFVARDGQEPCGNLRLLLKPTGSTPHIDEDLADEVLGQGTVVGEAQDKAVDSHAMPYVEHVHRVPVAASDGTDQSCV